MEGIEIKESERAKYLRIVMHPDGRIVVTKPTRMSLRTAEKWVEEKREWIAKNQKALQRHEKRRGAGIALPRLRRGTKAYKEAVAAARLLAHERLAYFNTLYKFAYGTVSIRNQTTRWGSCSAKGNLSFNYRIAQLPPELSDYLVVHELCHTREHNHSVRYWALVACAIPDYTERRRELQRYRF